MKKLLLFFLLLPSVTWAQKGKFFKNIPIDIPSRSITSPQTIVSTQAYSPGLFQISAGSPALTTNRNWKPSGAFPAMQINNAGSSKIEIVPDTGTATTFGSATSPATQTTFAGIGTTANIRMAGTDPTHPMLLRCGVIKATPEDGGFNCIQNSAQTSGTISYTYQNVAIDGGESSGWQNNTASGHYDTISLIACKVWKVAMEGIYQGNTGGTTAPVTYLNIQDFIADKTGRNGLQAKAAYIAQISNVLLVQNGLNLVSGQNEAAQIQDWGLGSYFRDFVIDSAQIPFSICTTGTTIENGRVDFYSTTSSTIQDIATGSNFSGSPRINYADTVFIRNVDFVKHGATITNLFQILETHVYYVFVNCRKTSNITNWVVDGAGGNAKYIVRNCSNFSAPPDITYKSYDFFDHVNYRRITSKAEYLAGRGPFVPNARR